LVISEFTICYSVSLNCPYTQNALLEQIHRQI
jgi:hypothetical protein